MNLRRSALMILAAVISLVLWWWLRAPIIPPPPPVAKPTPKVTAPSPSKSARLPSDRDWTKQLESKARLSARAWAKCFAPATLPQGRAQVTLNWDGSAHLTAVQVKPKVQSEIEECIAVQVRGWNLGLPPSLRPFRFIQEVIPVTAAK